MSTTPSRSRSISKQPTLKKSMSVWKPSAASTHLLIEDYLARDAAAHPGTYIPLTGKPLSRDNIGDDFFERFCGLQWRAHEYRVRADKEAEKEQKSVYNFAGSAVNQDERHGLGEELEELYVEVLYTIKHKIGQTDQHSVYNEELLGYVQSAFGIDNARHQRLLSKANQEKPPKVVLNITVVEGRDLEAKDANGFSDPYCMLGLIGTKSRKQVEVLPSTPSSDSPEELKDCSWRTRRSSLYKHNRTKSKRDCSATDILEQLPAKFIRTTTVKKETLNPVWNETFQLVIDNAAEDILHLDIFDHDDEYQVIDAVKNVKNVQGIKGLNRYFKQIAQSARKSAEDNVDDFLGSIDIKITDIPSIGIDKVFNLYSRSENKRRVQGSLRLRLRLATREDKYENNVNNLGDFLQHRDLITILMKHEVKKCKNTLEWNGELSDLAESVLHQHAIQGDLTDLQQTACAWIALIDIHVNTVRLNYLVLFQELKQLDSLWIANGLAPEAEEVTAEAVGQFKDFAMASLDRQSQYFPMSRPVAQRQLESLLKCMRILYDCKLFKRFFPLEESFVAAVADAVKTAAVDYYQKTRLRYVSETKDDEPVPAMEAFSNALVAIDYDLRKYFRVADKIYASFKIKYFAMTMAELDQLIYKDLETFSVLKQNLECAKVLENRDPFPVLKEDYFTAPGKEEPNSEIFVLYLALNDFRHLRRNFTAEERLSDNLATFHLRFIAFLLQWFSYAKVAAKRKMKTWVENDKVSRAESVIRYSTSVVEANNCLSLIIKFVKDLKWPDEEQNCILLCKLMNDVAEEAAYFSEITYRAFKDSGWIEHELLEVNDDLCIAVNNLETMRCHICEQTKQLAYFEATKPFRESGDPVLMKFATDCETILSQSLTNGQKMLTERITKSLEKLVKKMNGEIMRSLSKLVTSPVGGCEAVTTPLLEFMDVVLSNLYNIMLKANFLRFLEILWLNVLDQITAVTFSNRSREPMCFVNLYQSLSIFIEYFHAGEKGLPSEVIESERYHSVKRKVFYHQLSTQELIDTFLAEAVNVQSAMTKKPYGSITVRSHYEKKTSKVILEVIHARDVIPMDTNGLSDPFVIIRFLPTRLFTGVQSVRTAVVKRSLDPQFDEKFEFMVPVDKCSKDCSVIHLALMDHDMMFQDELAGEAFVQLCKLPGLRGEQTKNFAGLRETTIPLLHPNNMNKGILADVIDVLKCREQQKDGLDFLNILSLG